MKKIFLKRAFCLGLMVIFVFLITKGFKVEAYGVASSYNNLYEPGSIIVTLTNEQSLKFKEYTKEDFIEFECTDIEDLSKGSRVRLQQQINKSLEIGSLVVDPMNYHQQYKITIPEYLDIQETIQLLEQRSDVLYANPNTYIEIKEETTDVNPSPLSLYSDITVDMWVNDYLADSQWGLDQINICDAWDIEIGSSNVKVGIIDSGIMIHDDLKNRLDLSLFKSFTKKDPAIDQPIHGTSVAGIIGAEPNNEIGVAGVCHEVSLVSIKVTDSDYVKVANILSAIDYAIQENIPILNISMGGEITSLRTRIEYEDKIKEYPGLVVCAAGPGGYEIDPDVIGIYPACYNLDNLIAVGASDSYNNKTSTSNYSKNYVDIFAPGINIMTTYSRTSQCQMRSGTSFAAPFVSGVAALLLSYNPNFSAKDLKNIICSPNLDEYGNMVDSPVKEYCISGKVLDAAHALNLAKSWR